MTNKNKPELGQINMCNNQQREKRNLVGVNQCEGLTAAYLLMGNKAEMNN